MAIPRIDAYPVPQPPLAELNRVDWKPDVERVALLIHDVQRYFMAPFQSNALAQLLLANVDVLHRAAKAAGVPVIFTGQPAKQPPSQRGLNLDFWGPGMSDDADAEIVTLTPPSDDDLVVMKTRYSAFHGSPIAEHLAALERDQVIVCGVYARLGCVITAQDAYMHDIRPFLATDAIADFKPEFHLEAIELAAASCAMVATTETLVGSLG